MKGTKTMDKLQLKALAKINLGLDVLRRREDGYHEVKMIMQTIHLYDEIKLQKMKKPGIFIYTNLYYLPVNENNLVYKAAKLLMDEFSIQDGLFIKLKKNIPVSAGLAGGSSDAAATLWGINRMYKLGLSKEDLMKRGVKLGADVPFCILRGTALAEDIGEKLSVLPPMPKCHLLIAKPSVNVSTKFVYENLNVNYLKPEQHPNVDAQIDALRQGNLSLLVSRMGNILETVTIPAYPIIDKIKECMLEKGAVGAMMSGSGPTVFGVFHSKTKARQAYHTIEAKRLANQVYLTSPYNVHQ